jgi:hypothetical protein
VPTKRTRVDHRQVVQKHHCTLKATRLASSSSLRKSTMGRSIAPRVGRKGWWMARAQLPDLRSKAYSPKDSTHQSLPLAAQSKQLTWPQPQQMLTTADRFVRVMCAYCSFMRIQAARLLSIFVSPWCSLAIDVLAWPFLALSNWRFIILNSQCNPRYPPSPHRRIPV